MTRPQNRIMCGIENKNGSLWGGDKYAIIFIERNILDSKVYSVKTAGNRNRRRSRENRVSGVER